MSRPFQTLAQLAQAATATLKLSEVLARVAQAATDLLPDSAARIWTAVDHRLVLASEAGTWGPLHAGRKTELAFGEGLSGHVALTQEPLVVDDVLADPRAVNVDWMRQEGYISSVHVPLFARARLVGVLSLLTRDRHHFTSEEVEILTSFGTHAALAIQNAQLHAETERRRRAAEALAEVGRLISQSLDLDEVGQRIADSIRALLHANSVILYRLDPASGDLVGMALSGERGPAFNRAFVLARGIGAAGLAVSERRPIVTTNLLSDRRLTFTPEVRGRLEQAGDRAAFALPLITQGKVIGALGITDRAGRAFNDEEVRLAQAFADQAAIALENARLFREQTQLADVLKTHQARLEALLEVSRHLARIQPLESLLGSIAETCGRLLDNDSVGIRLVEGDDLVIAGTWGNAKEVMAVPRLKIGESVSGIVAASGEPLVVADPASDPRLIPAHQEAIRRLGYSGLLVVPIKIGGWVAGVLIVHTRRPAGFSPEDLAIVTAFAAHVAVALDNSRLYQNAQQAYEKLSETQDQLLQAQKMEAVGRLAGGIAHDFNNLLTVITGHSQLLLRRLRPEDPLLSDIDLISTTAGRAADLIRQLLAFSRRQVLQPKVLNLNQVVADMVPMLQRLIGEHIDLLPALDQALGQVNADPAQIEQVIVNLVVNARDAMPEGGRLTIETANVTLDATYTRQHMEVEPGPYVMLAVSDTGIGMSAETRARLFEPFFTTKGPGQGTGLGLATSYGIIKQSGGNIWVYSEPGQGTTFKIYLPRADEPAQSTARPSTLAPALHGSETILLVEDEVAVRELARTILSENGYTVLEARHGGEALMVSERQSGPIHLLLTDIVMPFMSGRVLAGRIGRTRPTLKVLYMSGYTDNGVVHNGVLELRTAYLQKPFTPDGLARKVREVLDGHPEGCP